MLSRSLIIAVVMGVITLASAGCSSVVQRQGTEQLLLSDAVDRSIDQLDMSPLAGRRVYLDTSYMRAIKSSTFVNAEYITSSLRQKMTTSGCLIQDNRDTAEYVLEARIGALGSDSMEVTYGIPSSNGVSQAASLMSGLAAIPSVPEISVGKRSGDIGIAKVMVFAYHRDTGTPVWQSGNAIARSDAKDSWVLGFGPVTRGSVYDETRIAGNRFSLPFMRRNKSAKRAAELTISDRHQFIHPAVLERQLADAAAAESDVQAASHEEAAAEAAEKK
jgi:hypothetical protein